MVVIGWKVITYASARESAIEPARIQEPWTSTCHSEFDWSERRNLRLAPLAGRGRRPLGRRVRGPAPRGDPSPLSSPRFRGARTNSFRAPPSVAQTTVSPNDQIHRGEVLVAPRRARGLRLLFFR